MARARRGSDPTPHGVPDADWHGVDAQGRPVHLTVWGQLHVRQARAVVITAVRIIRAHARNTKREMRESWFWWRGGPLPPLAELANMYPRRFGQEHG